MPVPVLSIRVGEYFLTATKQLRKITKLEKDNQGRDRVHYLSKNANIPAPAFNQAHTNAKPPLLPTFANDCDKQLSKAEINKLKKDGVILPGE